MAEPTRKPDRHPERSRRAILDATRQLLAQGGDVGSLTVEGVAAWSGVAETTIGPPRPAAAARASSDLGLPRAGSDRLDRQRSHAACFGQKRSVGVEDHTLGALGTPIPPCHLSWNLSRSLISVEDET